MKDALIQLGTMLLAQLWIVCGVCVSGFWLALTIPVAAQAIRDAYQNFATSTDPSVQTHWVWDHVATSNGVFAAVLLPMLMFVGFCAWRAYKVATSRRVLA